MRNCPVCGGRGVLGEDPDLTICECVIDQLTNEQAAQFGVGQLDVAIVPVNVEPAYRCGGDAMNYVSNGVKVEGWRQTKFGGVRELRLSGFFVQVINEKDGSSNPYYVTVHVGNDLVAWARAESQEQSEAYGEALAMQVLANMNDAIAEYASKRGGER